MTFSFVLRRRAAASHVRVPHPPIRPSRFLSTAPPPPPKAKPSRLTRYARRAAYGAAFVGSVYVYDSQFNASAIGRNVRTMYTALVVAVDYKMNFKAGQGEAIEALHDRVAERLFNLLVENGGLYIKIGQAIGANSAILPVAFQTRFRKLFDEAPQVPYDDVARVFEAEFGRPPAGENGVFATFDERAIASASIAQVHRATLKDGRAVAVKVQKPAVSKQVGWDLAGYRAIMWMYEKVFFDMPVYFLVDFITEHMRLELDFMNEARNAQETARLIATEPSLVNKVYIPKVYNEYTTKRVMTAEFIEGVKFSDAVAVRRFIDGAPKSPNASLPDPASKPLWDGASHNPSDGLSRKPVKGGAQAIMTTLVSLFSVQVFRWGFVHCDPHPGNIILRRLPSNEPQLVLLDHGLYVRVSDEIRVSYAKLWKSILSGDLAGVKEVAGTWGIGKGSEELLASGVLMRPWRERRSPPKEEKEDASEDDTFKRNKEIQEKLKQFLKETERFPKALIFIGRNLRIVQGNNQMLGTPVNRVKIIGSWASSSLVRAPNLTLPERMWELWHHAVYVTVIFSLDIYFWITKVRQWIRPTAFGSFEDEMEQELKRFSSEQLGYQINEAAFEG